MSEPPALPSTALEQAGAVVTEVSLELRSRTALTWAQYERLASSLAVIGQAYCWWIGDLLIYGEEIFGEEYAQIEASLPHSEHTLKNYRWVAKSIPPSRRRAGVGFGVHEAVASLPPDDRDYWLNVAQREGWKREQMRQAVRDARGQGELPPGSGPMDDPVVTSTARSEGELVSGPQRFCPHCGGIL